MTNFRILITHDGKHPASKWADLAVDDIMEISADAPVATLREAKEFQHKLHSLFTKHHQYMMDHEESEIAAGRHALDLPYDTEDHAVKVVSEIRELAKGTNFSKHFDQPNVQEHLRNVCNHYFKSAKHVERQHFHKTQAEQISVEKPVAKKTKKS
jgi:cobalamin biosynthesis Mg chelatase CobN